MKIIPIAFAFDNQLLFPAKICLSSLLMTANEDTFYDIFILHGDDITIDDTDFIRIRDYYDNCNIQFRPVPAELFKDCYEIRGITVATYYRLMIPQVVPEYDKIIYSDVDVIFREDQSKYYEMATMENCYVAGVRTFDHVKANPCEPEGGDPENFYAGNIIFNSKLIREKNINELFLKEIKKKHFYQDMDVLNIVCKDAVQFLPIAFCFTPRIERIALNYYDKVRTLLPKEEVDYAFRFGTVHYAGPKPWVTTKCFDADVWWNVYRKTLFFNPHETYKYGLKAIEEFEKLPLLKRMKILVRYFIH